MSDGFHGTESSRSIASGETRIPVETPKETLSDARRQEVVRAMIQLTSSAAPLDRKFAVITGRGDMLRRWRSGLLRADRVGRLSVSRRPSEVPRYSYLVWGLRRRLL